MGAAFVALVALVACKREPESVTISRDPADAAIADTTEPQPDTQPHDSGAPERDLNLLVHALRAVEAFMPAAPPGRVGAIRDHGHPPIRCWPSDPACSFLFEYGSAPPAGGVGSKKYVGRCTLNAHGGVLACGEYGKPLRPVTTIGGTSDASR